MWVTIDQIEELGITRRWTEKKVASGDWQARDSGRVGRNGKPIREVLLTSLPSELQWRWHQRQKERTVELTSGALQEEDLKDTSTLDALGNALKRLSPDVRQAMIAEAQRLSLIVERFNAIKPKWKVNPTTGKNEFVSAVLALCDEAACTDGMVQERHSNDRY